MSKDFEVKHRCPHHIRREWVPVQPDLRSVFPISPPSSHDIELRWNGYEVPRGGLQTPAKTVTHQRGPFNIEPNENDMVEIAVGGHATQQLQLPSGNAVGLRTIVDRMNDAFDRLNVSAVDSGMLIETTRAGRTSSFHLDGGSAHETLGLPSRRHFQGSEAFPGWTIQDQPDSEIENDIYILLDRPARADDNIFELSYFTRRQDCRRCQGIGIEFDIRFDETGAPITVTGEELLLQEVEKITLTVKGSNIFHEWYGTTIVELIGEKITPNADVLTTRMRKEIAEALERYKDVKTQQKNNGIPVPPEEFLVNILSINIEQQPNNPSGFDIQIRLQNKAGDIGTLNETIGVSSDSNEKFQLIA